MIGPGAVTAAYVVAAATTPRGELALRRRDGHWEFISNGVFLADDSNGESERLLVSAALAAAANPGRVLIGGLGMGFSLIEALADRQVRAVTVVEIEPDLLRWHREHLQQLSGRALQDPRTRLVVADILEWLDGTDDVFDLICCDIDNGPDWTVTESNAALYSEYGIDVVAARLAADGAAAFWSAAPSAGFEQRLRRRFGTVEAIEVPVPRGQPDVVYVAANVRPVPERDLDIALGHPRTAAPGWP